MEAWMRNPVVDIVQSVEGGTIMVAPNSDGTLDLNQVGGLTLPSDIATYQETMRDLVMEAREIANDAESFSRNVWRLITDVTQ
jgi:hypothetical protein